MLKIISYAPADVIDRKIQAIKKEIDDTVARSQALFQEITQNISQSKAPVRSASYRDFRSHHSDSYPALPEPKPPLLKACQQGRPIDVIKELMNAYRGKGDLKSEKKLQEYLNLIAENLPTNGFYFFYEFEPVVDSNGFTPHYHALQSGSVETLELLYKLWSSPKMKGKHEAAIKKTSVKGPL